MTQVLFINKMLKSCMALVLKQLQQEMSSKVERVGKILLKNKQTYSANNNS